MNDSFDAIRYIGYLRGRWRTVAASAAIAVAIALGVSLTMAPQYTATARVVIEPPAGMDARSSMAVSPIYLESLKTYEHFASSDSLFQHAMEKFGLVRHPAEAVKRRVLKVQIVRNTRILEIAVTLPEPVKAQALAKYIAEAAVELNRATVSEGDQDLLRGLAAQERDIRAQLEATEAAWARALTSEPMESLTAAMEQDGELRSRVQQQAQSVELEVADIGQRAKQNGPDAAELRREDANARVRLAEMRKQLQDADRRIEEREKLLAVRQAHRNKLEADRKADQTALAAIETRLRDARSESGFRGERMRIIDPGIVPERPSSPNLPLNVMAALLAGLVLPITYLTLLMSFEGTKSEPYVARQVGTRRGMFRAVKARDE
jgi:uncharacterized protein involved in exopolysaccharide biosynthesis